MTPVPLRRGVCDYCNKPGNVLPCRNCFSALYCKYEHEIASRPAHRLQCFAVSNLRRICQVLEGESWSNLPPGVPWTTACRSGLRQTRNYIEARVECVTALARIQTDQAS
ncbi:hypothetical protein BJY00DRAFT_284637 [Aspergillus carlsbadensis]|nr:hypothetical protein BJY00DRAFT_284637 [Aspergillus carlsbadensis]